jgi:hypothetical protein
MKGGNPKPEKTTVRLLESIPPWQWPDDAGEVLRRTMADRQANESDRLLAAELAGDVAVADDEMASALLALVRSADEPEKLRAQAAVSLGPTLELTDICEGNPIEAPPIGPNVFTTIQKTLRGLLEDATVPKHVRRRALEASVRAPQDWHDAAIRTAYADGDPDWKLTAVFCMSHIGGFDKEILEALEHPNPDIRYEAVVAAGESELEAAWPYVAGILNSPNPDKDLLIAAIEAAPFINPGEATDLVGQYTTSDDEEIAEVACEAMVFLEEPPGEDSWDEDDEDYSDYNDDDDEDEDALR